MASRDCKGAPMAEITLNDVTKRYPDGTEAVQHMNLDIADGEFMIFVGPSGCGKSTALRMIAGLEDISEQLALADVLEAGDHPQRGGLPATGGADEDHELAVGDVKVHVLNRLGPVRIALGHVVEGDLGHWCSFAVSASPLPRRPSDRRRCGA